MWTLYTVDVYIRFILTPVVFSVVIYKDHVVRNKDEFVSLQMAFGIVVVKELNSPRRMPF